MNIVYIVEDYSENGGVERIVSMKANFLVAENQNQVTLVSIYEDSRPCQYSLDANIPFVLLNVPFASKIDNPIYKLYSRVKTLFLAAYRLNKVLEQIQPDIIFFTTTLGALLLPLCHTKARKIYESHLSRSFNPYHTLFRWMEKNADTIVCLTEEDAHEFKYTKDVRIIPNFVHAPTVFVNDYSCKKAIAVGRLEQQKGFDRLIKCWKVIAEQYPDWKLDIYGEGSLHEILQSQIEALCLEQQVTLCGRCENMMDKYPNYSLHVMSSHYEGQPIVLIEAQACGLPSVSFDFKYGASDIVKKNHNGILVKQDDEPAFADAIMKMMANAHLRQEYGTNAIEMVKKYSQEHIMKQWQKLILEE